jgi:dTDP-4-amino-4,6-dideoxygalactose transaminase
MAQYADLGHIHDFSISRGKEPHYVRGFNYRIGEINSAIGIVQLEKYKRHTFEIKTSKKKLKDKIASNGSFKYREILDEENETGDTIVIICKDREHALSINDKITNEGFMTKILPEAMGWHFAAHWDHLLTKLPYYKDKDLKKMWTQSAELLERSVGIGIGYKMTDEKIDRIASCFISG